MRGKRKQLRVVGLAAAGVVVAVSVFLCVYDFGPEGKAKADAEAYASRTSRVDAISRENEAFALYESARSLQTAGLHGEAIVKYKRVVSLKPDHVEAYLSLGSAYGHLGRYSDEVWAYKQLLAVKPDHADAYVGMGVAYSNLKQHHNSLASLKRAVAIKPDLVYVHAAIGGSCGKLGLFTDAVAAYKKVIALKPRDADAHVGMGMAYSALRQYAQAEAAFKKAIAINPNGKSAMFTRERLGKLAKRSEQ